VKTHPLVLDDYVSGLSWCPTAPASLFHQRLASPRIKSSALILTANSHRPGRGRQPFGGVVVSPDGRYFSFADRAMSMPV